jgi:hypothetical protein
MILGLAQYARTLEEEVDATELRLCHELSWKHVGHGGEEWYSEATYGGFFIL